MGRVLVIGIDGATLDLIEPWVRDGHLPHIGRLMRDGGYAPLRSTLPVMSPPAWTSMITGQNPGKHGIYDFLRLLPGSYRIQATRSDQTIYRTMFDLASQYGRHVIAVNVPLTYPPRPVNGVIIPGPIVPSRGVRVHPPELEHEVRASGYRFDVDVPYFPGNEAAYLEDMAATSRSQLDMMLRLMRREPWDLAMVVLRDIDEVQAFFWRHMDPEHPQHDPAVAKQFGTAIEETHHRMDEAVGQLLELTDFQTTVLLVSDHGGGALHKEVFLNVWLEQKGWLVRKRDRLLNRWRKRIQRRTGLTREKLAPKLDFRFAYAIRRRIPQRVQHALIPEQSKTLADLVDWSRTRAYSIGNIGQIYVNLRGREPQGIVEPGRERDELLAEISTALKELADEDGPVVDAIYRSEEVYHGPYASRGPDLNIIMRGMSYVSQSWREMEGEAIFAFPSNHVSGIHRPLGMAALYGANIAARGPQHELQIVDIAPTVLSLLGLPIPDDIDGRLLAEFMEEKSVAGQQVGIIEAAFAPAPEVVEQSWADADEEAEVLDRLRDLGYLE